MTLLFTAHGMRRSGNHAVIAWLRRNLGVPSVFLNDCAPGDPYLTFELMETPDRDLHGPQFRKTRWFRQFPEGRSRMAHVVSYEDTTPADTGLPAGWGRPSWVGILIHRSFLNWLASYYTLVVHRQSGTRWGVDHPSEIAASIGIYAALLGETSRQHDISYDRWRADPDYRIDRLAALGLEPIDNDLGTTERYGGGSSFCAGDPARRWVFHATDRHFRALAADAAKDRPLMKRLEYLYPNDAARLAHLAKTGILPED